jgi:hypothetical protein
LRGSDFLETTIALLEKETNDFNIRLILIALTSVCQKYIPSEDAKDAYSKKIFEILVKVLNGLDPSSAMFVPLLRSLHPLLKDSAHI